MSLLLSVVVCSVARVYECIKKGKFRLECLLKYQSSWLAAEECICSVSSLQH